MNNRESLYAAISAAAGVTALVAGRIYPLIALPPDMQNAIVCVWEQGCEYTESSVGPVYASLEIRCWSADTEVAHQIADAVRAVLSPSGQPGGFRGLLGGAGGIDVTQCLWAAEGARETEHVIALADQFVYEVRSPYSLIYNL